MTGFWMKRNTELKWVDINNQKQQTVGVRVFS